jgi:hypothetical protein
MSLFDDHGLPGRTNERLSLQFTHTHHCKELSLSYDTAHKCLIAIYQPSFNRGGFPLLVPSWPRRETAYLSPLIHYHSITVARSPHTKETRIGPQFSLNLASPVLAAPLALPQTPRKSSLKPSLTREILHYTHTHTHTHTHNRWEKAESWLLCYSPT